MMFSKFLGRNRKLSKSFSQRNFSLNLNKTLQDKKLSSRIKRIRSESMAAEANPIRFSYDEKIIQKITERNRMIQLTQEDPRYYNIYGLYPQVVEEEDIKMKNEKEDSQYDSMDEEGADIQLDKVTIDEASDIIYEMTKDRYRSRK